MTPMEILATMLLLIAVVMVIFLLYGLSKDIKITNKDLTLLFNAEISLFERSNISPTQIPKSFHKPLKKWKVKSEKGGRQFVKSVEG